jgi:hypothetical protein
MSKNMVEPERPEMTIWPCVTCWLNKATRAQAYPSARAPTNPLTHTHTHQRACVRTYTHRHTHKYVVLIALPWQQWFREPA